ncbi:MAG: hypothetical protein ACLQBD_25615 [Syntrophobacteraceae bacterium]
MASVKVMKLIDAATGLMECRVCGQRHRADIKPQSGGKYYRGSWQCIHGCKPGEEPKTKG